MKITALNLQGFTDWQHRSDAIIDYIKATNPDLILFQEVVFIPEVSNLTQVQLLNEQLQYSFEQSVVTRLQPSPHYQTYREGLAILSKYPVIRSDSLVLKQMPGDEHNRLIQLVDVAFNDGVVKFANIHFSLSDTVDYATPHLQETLEILDSRNEQRIIGGDFNLDHLEEQRDLWQANYVASTIVPYVSFPEESKRNDYFLIPKAYQFESIATSRNGLSDHRAVTVDIRPKESPAVLYRPARPANVGQVSHDPEE